jgi:1-acyl-sn-glycerol-3-phosphate acyltransferase
MKILKNIFARIWALWALISFVITFLIIFLPSMVTYLIPGVKGQLAFIKISRIWMNVWLWLAGCPVTIKGRENFSADKTYVVVFNHNALLDVPLSAPYVPVANKTIAKASFAKVPLFGWFYKKGAILVDRNDDKSRTKSYEAMKNVLLTGMSICIYPEGTRNRTNEPLKKFYDGAFKLAAETKKEVIPCVIFNTKKAMPIDKIFYLLPTRLQMHFLPPVSSENISAKVLKQQVFDMMWKYYEENKALNV